MIAYKCPLSSQVRRGRPNKAYLDSSCQEVFNGLWRTNSYGGRSAES